MRTDGHICPLAAGGCHASSPEIHAPYQAVDSRLDQGEGEWLTERDHNALAGDDVRGANEDRPAPRRIPRDVGQMDQPRDGGVVIAGDVRRQARLVQEVKELL